MKIKDASTTVLEMIHCTRREQDEVVMMSTKLSTLVQVSENRVVDASHLP